MPSRNKPRKKKTAKSAEKPRRKRVVKATGPATAVEQVDVLVPEPTTDVVTEKTYITTEPEIEIRRPATLAQALTEPAVAVVKPKTRVQRVRAKTRRAA
jgi:hypothetical protein